MVPLLVSKDVASECFGRFFFLKGQALFHAFWHRILPCLSWKQLELEHPVSSLENYIYFWMFFCGETTIETVLCRKPSCDFVNFHDWPSWQKVTMTRPTTWRFGRLMPWRHARIAAEQGAAAVFSMFHIPNYIQKQLLQY